MNQSYPSDIPLSIFLGFCSRKYAPPPKDWQLASTVTEVCTASDCIASRPPGWIQHWNFSRASCWNDEDAATSIISPEERSQYRLYAYKTIPLVFGEAGVSEALSPEELFYPSLPALPPEPDLSGYEFLGYDAVEYAGSLNYGCSPLSCNGMSYEYSVNQYCLLDSLELAWGAALSFGVVKPEPGPYILFEIWRKREE